MRVNIIVEHGDMQWIGGRLASELAIRLHLYGFEATVNGELGATLTYHQIVYGPPPVRPAVGLFTHGADRPRRLGSSYDGQVVMNPAMLTYLESMGAANPILIEQPVADIFINRRPIVFGVAGRVYGDGRKGEHLVEQMVKAGYQILAWGHGWPCKVFSCKVKDLVGFYQNIDYYVDTSSDEGGCTPALEAMAMGVPVISHTLGVDRPVLAYETHSWDSLSKVLHKLTHSATYDDWAREHAEYFKAVLARLEVAV